MSRRIRIFVSSPGDVEDERRQCGEVVQELNVTLRALVPEREIDLELVRWETHTHPDLSGTPQRAVDEQIDADYDIFLGIMWSRFGTPTSTSGSGTEHEFRAAHKGWEEARKPAHLLFYFCEAPISAALAGQMADQLKAVYAFRTQLSQLGLVGSYEDREHFGDQVRRDLVLVLGRLLFDGAAAPPQRVEAMSARVTAADLSTARSQVQRESAEYQRIRSTMPPGDRRTRRMEVVASRLRTLAQSVYPLLPELVASNQAGDRLAAVTTLQAIPTIGYVNWLAERVCVEKPFIGYHAALALLEAVRALPPEDLDQVARALERAEDCARSQRVDTDRNVTLDHARRELSRRGNG